MSYVTFGQVPVLAGVVEFIEGRSLKIKEFPGSLMIQMAIEAPTIAL